jgi:hypothetical protein
MREKGMVMVMDTAVGIKVAASSAAHFGMDVFMTWQLRLQAGGYSSSGSKQVLRPREFKLDVIQGMAAACGNLMPAASPG